MKSSHLAECPDLGPQCPNVAPYNHELRTYAYGVTLDAKYRVNETFALALSVPLRAVTTTVRYTDLSGNEIHPDDTHHANRTLTGLGDPLLLAIVGHDFDRISFTVRAGAMLPLGRTLDEDPFLAGREGRVHEHVQFGAGTVRPVLGSTLKVSWFDGWMLGILSLADNAIGYRAGQRGIAGGRVSYRGVGVGAEVSHESAETWSGLQPGDGNMGRTDVVALASFSYSFEKIGLFAMLRVPLYVNAVGAQLSYPAHLQLGVSTAF